MPLDRISQYEKAILSTINPELQKSFLEKGGLTNERKMEPDASLKESTLPYLWINQKGCPLLADVGRRLFSPTEPQ